MTDNVNLLPFTIQSISPPYFTAHFLIFFNPMPCTSLSTFVDMGRPLSLLNSAAPSKLSFHFVHGSVCLYDFPRGVYLHFLSPALNIKDAALFQCKTSCRRQAAPPPSHKDRCISSLSLFLSVHLSVHGWLSRHHIWLCSISSPAIRFPCECFSRTRH